MNSKSILGAIKQVNIFKLRYPVNIIHLSRVLVNYFIFTNQDKQLLLCSATFVNNVSTRIPDNLYLGAQQQIEKFFHKQKDLKMLSIMGIHIWDIYLFIKIHCKVPLHKLVCLIVFSINKNLGINHLLAEKVLRFKKIPSYLCFMLELEP